MMDDSRVRESVGGAESCVADGDLGALYRSLHETLDRIESASASSAAVSDVIEFAESHERAARRMSGIGLRRLKDVSERAAHVEAGYPSLAAFMKERLRIVPTRRRQDAMAAICARVSLSGEALAPQREHLATAVAEGALGPEHVTAVLDILKKIPVSADPVDVETAEATLVDVARAYDPTMINRLGNRVLAHLDPDGTLTDERDRKRRRGVSVGGQGRQSMSKLTGYLDPVTRAQLDVVLAVWAQPGMNNPEGEQSPAGDGVGVDPEVLKDAAQRDRRTPAQRNHDALSAFIKASLDGGVLGQSHRGLPPHIIVSVTDAQLREYAGFGVTATGVDLPIGDVVALAARAQWHLAVFEEHTSKPLYLGTGRRTASRAQRMMLIAAHGPGCTCPECPRSSMTAEIHHAELDWALGGKTDITALGAACGIHNRQVGDKPGQFTTGVLDGGPDSGAVTWTRNPQPGQPPNPPRINLVHRLDVLLERHRARLRGDHDDLGPPATTPLPAEAVDTGGDAGGKEMRPHDADTAPKPADLADERRRRCLDISWTAFDFDAEAG